MKILGGCRYWPSKTVTFRWNNTYIGGKCGGGGGFEGGLQRGEAKFEKKTSTPLYLDLRKNKFFIKLYFEK